METTEAIDTETTASEKEEFIIDTEERLNWYLRKLANLDAERQRIKSQAAAMIARLDTDENGLKHRFESQVIEFTRRQIEGTRRKSYQTLQGTLSFRTVPPSLKITDEDAALTFAQKYSVCLDTAPRLDPVKYREHAKIFLADSGELIPGVELSSSRESFSITFGKSTE